MANRYDIIHIDFQASARGANAAIESIRQEADKCNNRITELKKNISEAPKDTDAKILEGWDQELKVAERRYRQLTQAQKELMKGMRALDEGVKMFNDGSLSAMNAAFQKTVNNAAKLAQSKLTTGSKEWRQMGALMQETEQNYSRMMRDTDQLIESLKNGGTVFRKTLEDEKKGLQELLQVLPYMGTEYRKASDQLDFLTKKTDEMAIKEKQLKGEIVTTDDARRVSLQLTKEGAEAAKQRAAAADVEIEKGKKEIETLEKEREAREANARASAQAAAEYRENQQMYEDEIDRLQREIKAEEERAKSGKTGVEAMYRKAKAAGDAADKELDAQKKLDAEYETAKNKVAALREEYEKMKQAAGSAPVNNAGGGIAAPAATSKKEETQAVNENAAAKKNEAKAGEEVAETNKKEAETAETLKKKHEGLVKETNNLIAERDKLTSERNSLVRTLEAEAAAAERAANAFASLSKEEAEAMLKERQATITKGADGKFSYTNAENAQHFLIESMRQVNPANAKGDAFSLDSAGVAKVRAMFKERFGLQSDDDALAAIRGLLSGENGSLIKGGMMNNAFSRIDLDTSKVTAYSKIIKDLTDVINGEVKAIDGESEAKKRLEQVNTRLVELDEKIDANDKESREIFRQRRAMMGSEASATEELTEKTNELSEAKKKDAEATNAQIEAIKKLSVEEAKAAKDAMTKKSTVDYKSNKLDMSNPEEVQSWLITQMLKHGASVGSDGTLSVGGANVNSLLTGFKDRYGLKGDNQKAKQLFKDVIQGKGGGGLLREGGVIDFSADTLMVKANAEAYQGRIDKLKALFEITNKASYAAAHSTETTERGTRAVKDATEATKDQTAAEQKALEVKRLKEAYDKSQAEYDKMKEHLAGLKKKRSGLPSGMDAALERESLTNEINDYDENVKKPKGREVTKLKNQWQKAAQQLAQMQAEETTAENQNTEATERNTRAKGGKKKASEDAAKATGEETQKSAELIAKEKELKDAEDAEAEALKKKEAQQKKTNDAVEKAESANDKAKQSEADLVKSLDEKGKKLKENKEGLEKLNEANKDTIATNEKNQKLLAETNGKIQEQGEKIRDAERIKAQAKTDGIEKTEQAIRLLTEENRHIDQNSFTWKRNTIEIQHLQEALDEMKGKPALMMMEQRMKNVGALSTAAVAETKKFWEAMVAGSAKGSEGLKEAEAHLKTITEEEQKRTMAATKQQARGLFGDLSKMNGDEIRQAIEAGRTLINTYESGSPAAQRLAQAILDAEEHLKNYGIEAERNARREAAAIEEATKRRKEQDLLMRQQLDQGTSLSESALRAQQQYWQRLIDDPKTATESLAGYRYELERTMELQEQQAATTRNERAAKLGGNLADMSEGEIREAIEAGKQLIQTYKSGSTEAETLAKNILAAENHIKNYGLDAQRAAQREAQAIADAAQKRKETDTAMRKQLYNQQNLSESALKAQEQYWRRLIDDPNTAAESLKHYEKDLEHVHKLQEQMARETVRTEGEAALKFFEGGIDNASANDIKENAAALKKYRDSLPQESEADTIKKINDYLVQAGAAAKTMTMKEALRVGLDARGGNFKGTVEQLTLAKKTLEELQQKAVKGGLAWRRLQEGIDSINLELKRTGHLSGEVMDILNNPKGKSFNELKQAIEQGRKALASMRTETEQDQKEFAELAAKIKEADFQMKALGNSSKGTANAFEKAWGRFKTYVTFYVSAAAAIQKVIGTFGDLMELSDKMGEVRKTTGFTADEVGRLSDNLKRLDVRTPLTQLMEISAKAGQLGLKSEKDVMGFTEAANKLMIALPEMGTEAATELMKVAIATGEVKKIQEQLNKGLIEGSSATEVALSKVGSVIDQLRANSAAAAPQITDFVKRVGAVGAQSGISIDQVAALGATVDALGMRVEMSATALSRMIPAIRNNAFEVAKAIGMAPNALREMFEEAGGGMEAMLAIFQHIKDSGMDPDSIEKMLNLGGMQDVMKQLNQQGARAGIVFAGLSQNVDELRRNLGVAAEAYEDNIAILQEYNKMNETTAAKWERLKNQLEEFFVGGKSEQAIGWIIDRLRSIVDLLTGDNGISAGLRTVLMYLALVRLKIAEIVVGGLNTLLLAIKNIGVALGFVKGEMKALQMSNIFTALAMAALWAWNEISNLKSALSKANEALGKTKEELGHVIDRFEGYWRKIELTNDALKKARVSHEALSVEVDKLRKTTDGSAESTANLKKKEDELEASEKNVTKASNDHKSAIAQMNSIYGKYLGFILTEANYSNLAAAAHDKVTAAIEREMYMKQRQAALGNVDSSYANDIATGYGNLNERLVQSGKLSRSEAAKAMGDMQRFMRENLKYDAGANATVVSKAIMNQLKRNGLDVSKADANEIAALWFDQYLRENYHLSDKVRRGLTGVERRSDVNEGWGTVYTPFADNLRGGYAETYAKREKARGAVSTVYNVDIEYSEGREAAASGKLLENLEKSAQNAKKVILNKNTDDKKRNEAYGELANALEGLDNRINELDPQKDAATINRLNDMAKSLKGDGIDIKKLKQAREKIHQTLFERATFNEEDIRNLDTTNPWGGSHSPDSTDWKNMTADELVARRKQMKEYVNAIQTDSDVKKVLAEDAALMKAFKGRQADMRSVIEWYNTERLKIQDELHARHLTNTGDWMDPKKQKAAKKQFQNEVKAYLEELDAYYTERNQEIQTARNNEEITEAEAWRRTIKNETEWYNRRAELQKLYSEKGAEVTQEEQDAIFNIIAERTGDSTTFIQKMIGKTIQFAKQVEKSGEKGAAVVHKWRADLDLGTERDYLKSAKSIGKHMKFIEDTLAKERPYDGITKNLQENLDKMGVLAAQYKRINDELEAQGKKPKYSNEEITAATYDEMAFFLKQAENAWSIDIDELLRRMAQEGMAATAEEISKSEMLKQAVMGQLRKTFEDVQNAVKKEANQIKKDVDIIWNDDTRGPGGMSMKAAYDQAIARLGMQQDSVSRANSLIGAGPASDNVATRLAMKQIEMQMRMQKTQFDMYRVQANQRMTALKQEAEEHRRIARQMEQEGDIAGSRLELLKATNAELDAENVKKSLGLTLAEETKKEEEDMANLLKLQEESRNRLYKTLREWSDLLASSVREVMEASNAGNAEYYNERAKMNLTGKGGPGAGTYVVIDDAGTSDAKAHYEYLDERAALERQHEIEIENARAEAWKKVFDEINMKLSETITDQLNAMLQNASMDANTQAILKNTEALSQATAAIQGGNVGSNASATTGTGGGMAVAASGTGTDGGMSAAQSGMQPISQEEAQQFVTGMGDNPMLYWTEQSDAARQQILQDQNDIVKNQRKAGNDMAKSAKTSFAAMTAAANMYGIAYQTMSNDNLTTTQKVEMMIVQAAGQAMISMLTASLAANTGETAANAPSWISKTLAHLGPIGGPVAVGVFTALIGGLLGIATSKIAKSKSQIAQVTGAGASAGKLSTGMLTYATGNVNEFTDPDTLTPGRQYNVDAADGRTYRARYMGSNPRTHLTNGPEFHLAGERGREMIIDAGTTRQITMNEGEIWHAIKTLSGGGRMPSTRYRRGVRAFAEGNVDDFEEMAEGSGYSSYTSGGITPEMAEQMQASLDRNSEVMEQILANGIHAYFDVYGKGGLVDSYDTGKKTVKRHGEKY